MKDGKRCSGSIPYGYNRLPTDKQTLVVDPMASEVVKHIFLLANDGKSPREIAEILTEEKVLIPAAHAKEYHPEQYNGIKFADPCIWSVSTAEYRSMVDKAVEIGERQKKRVDPMYHEKIDSLVDTYARKLAENMNSSFSIEARVPSILIAGGSNFPVRKKEKQNAARDRNMEEWNDIQGLLDKIRSTGMGGISADDPQAVQKLEAKLEKLQTAQDTMKAVNAYYRKHKTLDGCPNLSAERIEKMKGEMSAQWHIEDKPYPSWALSNNSAEIRRVKGRIAELTRKQETAYAGWEFDGGTVEANREDNRLQIFFEEKPDEKTRETLKENGFRWSPKAGAWQRQLNDNAIYAADRLSCIRPLSGKSPVEIQKEARTAAKTEKKPSIRAQLAQDKEALKAAPKKAAEKTKKQDLERS